MNKITEIIPNDMPEWMRDAMDEGQLFNTVIGRFKALQDIVSGQAEDEGLWFGSENVTEAFLQHELRRLHAAIEFTVRK